MLQIPSRLPREYESPSPDHRPWHTRVKNTVLRYSNVLHFHQRACHKVGDTMVRTSRFTNTEHSTNTMDQLREISKAYMRAGTWLVTMSSVVPARIGSIHVLPLQPRELFTVRTHIDSAAGNNITASLAVYLEMMDVAVDHVLATNCLLGWAKRCWNKKNEEGQFRACNLTMAKNVSLETCTVPYGSVKSGMKWLRYDTMKSPGKNMYMKLKETCSDNVKQILIMWSEKSCTSTVR